MVQKTAADRAVLARRIDQALGRAEADLVIKDTRYLVVPTGAVAEGDIAICGDTIVGIGADYRGRTEIDGRRLTVVPGFIDSHVHVESSLVTPAEFDRCVLPRGTTTAICDPHEIANVLGVPGLHYVLDAAQALVMDLRVMLSSCVPSTDLETSGARLGAADLEPLRAHPSALGLAEMMNFEGLFAKEDDVLEKLAAFQDGLIDGHAPLVSGRKLSAYAACGIRTCHETTRRDEGREKLEKGLQLLIREGSVAKSMAELAPLLTEGTSPFVAFCTDDRNPLDIAEEGHIDHLVRAAIRNGVPPAAAYRAASWSAARAYGLRDRGLVAPGWRADLVLLEDYEDCIVHTVLKDGLPVTAARLAAVETPAPVGLGSVKRAPVDPGLFAMPAGAAALPVIGLNPGSLVTDSLTLDVARRDGHLVSDPARDVMKIAVLERHGRNGNVGRGFVHGFGLQRGAIAGSVGHDSHNLTVVGADDEAMALAVNRLIDLQGGYVAVHDGDVLAELALPIAGLMSDRPFAAVADGLHALRFAARSLGCTLTDPFLHLAFLPLPVIPHLRLTDCGLVDVDRFELLAA
ncbi:MAG: adenine deaminase [Alphaproteobacteria bacterium]|jgi:adenine deaminase|nr:adenine deaminase [Alphaproteobacteria bacterium]